MYITQNLEEQRRAVQGDDKTSAKLVEAVW
jgi:hypothetical protein